MRLPVPTEPKPIPMATDDGRITELGAVENGDPWLRPPLTFPIGGRAACRMAPRVSAPPRSRYRTGDRASHRRMALLAVPAATVVLRDCRTLTVWPDANAELHATRPREVGR